MASPFDQLARDPIFVIGAARSGTTWISDILAAHPQVARIHESWLFTQNDGVGSLFTNAHWPPKPSGLGSLLGRDELVCHVREMVTQIMSHAIQPEHRFIVEKSPSHAFAIALICELFPGALFIHALRDGRDVCVSVRAAAQSWMPAWKMSFGRSVATSARAWRDETLYVENAVKTLGSSILEIRYEDIHADPFASYRRIFDFCGIPYDDSILQHVHQDTDFAQNYEPGENKFRRGGRVADWQRQFSLLDALIFNYVAGQRLVELGYEKNRFWLPHRCRQQINSLIIS